MTDPRLAGRVPKVSGRANRSWLPPAPARVTISRRRDADGNAAIAAIAAFSTAR